MPLASLLAYAACNLSLQALNWCWFVGELLLLGRFTFKALTPLALVLNRFTKMVAGLCRQLKAPTGEECEPLRACGASEAEGYKTGGLIGQQEK